MMNGSALPAFRDSAATHQPRLKCGGECPVYDNHLDEVTDRSWSIPLKNSDFWRP
jgi:hypothetical protein